MQTIGIIAAMTQESQAVLGLLKECTDIRIGSLSGKRFLISGRECWLVTSGMGPIRAALAADALIKEISPQLLISLGVAGAVGDKLDVGDVVISRTNMVIEKYGNDLHESLRCLSGGTWQAAFTALQVMNKNLYYGTAITTRGAQSFPQLAEELPNPILEMETSGIVKVTRENGIPLLSIRAISDGPGAPIPFNLEKMMDDQYNLQIWKILMEMLFHPKIIPQMLKMGQNTKLAAHNAAIVLLAVLSQADLVE